MPALGAKGAGRGPKLGLLLLVGPGQPSKEASCPLGTGVVQSLWHFELLASDPSCSGSCTMVGAGGGR